MHRTASILCLGMITGAVLGVIGAQTLRAQQPAESRKVLVTQDLEGIDGYEIRTWRTHIGPGVTGQKHYHPGTECTYVLAGTLILANGGEQPVIPKAGDAQCARPRHALAPPPASP